MYGGSAVLRDTRDGRRAMVVAISPNQCGRRFTDRGTPASHGRAFDADSKEKTAIASATARCC
jgi:hypothetical protein